MEYSKRLNKENWYLNKIQKIDQNVGWQNRSLFDLQISFVFNLYYNQIFVVILL